MGIALAVTGEVWHIALKREKEHELLFVGDQLRRAINSYYETCGLGFHAIVRQLAA